jgi:SH3-like domain-containing protein
VPTADPSSPAVTPRRGNARAAFVLSLLLACVAVPPPAPGLGVDAAFAQTGLPLPRFVSLRSAEINLRTGPGGSYPVDWVYQRRNMPVEVIAEFDNWRKVRDWQGTVGWVHQNLLSGERYARITDAERLLLSRPGDGAPVAWLMPGVVAHILSCRPDWCELEADGHRGWLSRESFWGVYPHEVFD